MSSQGRLAGDIAIITGGASGFGKVIVEKFIEQGAKVLMMDLSVSDGPMKGYNEETCYQIKADVTNVQDWQKAVQVSQEKLGKKPNICVNNAGWTYSAKPTLQVTLEEYQKVFDINLTSIFHSTNVLIPVMKELGGGNFVQISSTAAIRPRPNLTWYNATKAAMSTASKSMALEFAKDKIRFNMVNPVAGNTPLLSKFAGAAESGGEVTAEQLKVFNDSVPMGRLSEPSDIANAALFFADSASNFITGVEMLVDGGRCV